MMLALYKEPNRPYLQVLCAVQGATQKEGCGFVGDSSEDIHQSGVWTGGL